MVAQDGKQVSKQEPSKGEVRGQEHPSMVRQESLSKGQDRGLETGSRGLRKGPVSIWPSFH